MIVKHTIANEQIKSATMRSSSHPMTSVRIPNSQANVVGKEYENDIVKQYEYPTILAKIQMRFVVSLMFAFLPGLTQIPSLARSAVPVVLVTTTTTTTGVPGIAPASATAASSDSLNQDDLLSRSRSMDAARLIMDDYSGKRRAKIPVSVKKQMDMQDRRLEICQEVSRDEWEWEQCFYYGTENGAGGALYFDGVDFGDKNSAAKTAAKPKVPTW